MTAQTSNDPCAAGPGNAVTTLGRLRKALGVAGAVLMLLDLPMWGEAAQAQTQAAVSEPVYGPAIAGICVFSRDAAIDNSAAGLAATKRMQDLTAQVNGELQPERDAIAKEQTALNGPKAGLSAADLKSRNDALSARTVAFARKVQTRNAQLIRTRQDALAKLTDALRPALISAITTNKCSAVFERTNIYGFNKKMDITAEVSASMKATTKPFGFDLVPEATVVSAKQ
jgi:Skp family chaperone for outer membrane proteins